MGKGIPRMGIYSTPDSTRLPDGRLRILHDSKRLLDYLAQQVVPAGIGQFLIILLQDPQVLCCTNELAPSIVNRGINL